MKKLCPFIVLVFFSTLNQDVLCSPQKAEDKIVGGRSASDDGGSDKIEDVPYQAVLQLTQDGSEFQCGGSILNKKYILTAAHCVLDKDNATVRIGSTQGNSGGTLYYAERLLKHPKYSHDTKDYDVGIIKVTGEIKLDGTETKAIKLPDSGSALEPGTVLVISGWGGTEEDGQATNTLKVVRVPTVSKEDCKKNYNLTDRMFCAGFKKGGTDACQGDSGGPAVLNNTDIQVGIISYGKGCARPGIPGVYTDVAKVRDWIEKNTSVDDNSRKK